MAVKLIGPKWLQVTMMVLVLMSTGGGVLYGVVRVSDAIASTKFKTKKEAQDNHLALRGVINKEASLSKKERAAIVEDLKAALVGANEVTNQKLDLLLWGVDQKLYHHNKRKQPKP